MIFYKKNKFFFLPILFVFLFLFAGCKKDEKKPSGKETGTVTDVQGNEYLTVKIGSQWWMVENLRVRRYNDSTAIEAIQDSKDWIENKNGSFTFIEERYGLHYNWFAINSNKLAPKGWHIPSDEEWKMLEREIGMEVDEANKTAWRGESVGEKLIAEGSIGWPGAALAPIYGTNESGFSALPGGCKGFNGANGEVRITAFFWTSSQNSNTTAWYRNLSVQQNKVFRYFADKNYGFSVRCVKD